jgi:beta-lactamase class A
MRFKGSSQPMLAVATIAAILGGCVSSAAIVPPAHDASSRHPVRSHIPAPVLDQTADARRPITPPQADPGFRRPPAGLDERIGAIWSAYPGKTGLAVQRIDGEWTVSRRGDELFPQQSVSKFWVTLTVMDAIDRGRLRLDQNVVIRPEDLTLFNQPIAGRVHAQGSVTHTVRELIDLAITASDNTANDSLLRTVGGPEAVRAFIANKGLGAIRFGPGERLLQSRIAAVEWKQSMSSGRNFEAARSAVPMETRRNAMNRYLADPMDGASPLAIVRALTRLARGNLLSPESTRHVLSVMERTRSGPQRLKAGFPAGWRFGHKTGTGQNFAGFTAGYNDIGIATAPDGTRYAFAVLMGQTSSPIIDRMKMMQSISRTTAEFHGR